MLYSPVMGGGVICLSKIRHSHENRDMMKMPSMRMDLCDYWIPRFYSTFVKCLAAFLVSGALTTAAIAAVAPPWPECAQFCNLDGPGGTVKNPDGSFTTCTGSCIGGTCVGPSQCTSQCMSCCSDLSQCTGSDLDSCTDCCQAYNCGGPGQGCGNGDVHCE